MHFKAASEAEGCYVWLVRFSEEIQQRMWRPKVCSEQLSIYSTSSTETPSPAALEIGLLRTTSAKNKKVAPSSNPLVASNTRKPEILLTEVVVIP